MTKQGFYADGVKERGRKLYCGGEVGVSSVRTSLRLGEGDVAAAVSLRAKSERLFEKLRWP
jgi:hypothetical protein